VTHPRFLLPGRTYMVTRRCHDRRFILKPRDELRRAFLSCLARAASLFEVQIHAFCVLSNHDHIALTDTASQPQLPRFMAALNRELARFLNALYRRGGAVWDNGKHSRVHLPSKAELLDKIVYTLSSPVAAGLVEKVEDWPGLVTLLSELGERRNRPPPPQLYYRPRACEVSRPSLKLTHPPCYEDASLADFQRDVRKALEARVHQLTKARTRPVLGAPAVLAQSPLEQPKPPSRGLKPRVAHKGQGKWRRIELLQALSSFRERYREAWRQWDAGFRETVFPNGTYMMRELYDVQCAAVFEPG
jgi:putative transposase